MKAAATEEQRAKVFLRKESGRKKDFWDTSTSSTYTIYHISSGAQSEPICQRHSTVPIERTKNVCNTMDGVSIMLVCKRSDVFTLSKQEFESFYKNSAKSASLHIQNVLFAQVVH